MPAAPLVSIVIPVWNQAGHTRACLDAIARTAPPVAHEIIVVDNASTDETPRLLAGRDVTVIRNPQNVGYTLACNQGAQQARGGYVCLLNNDTEPQPGWLEALVAAAASSPDVGAVGAKLTYADGRLQEAGGLIFSDGSGWNFGRGGDPGDPRYNRRYEVDYVSGACLLVRREDWEALGGFDERFAPAYYEDTDLCFALRARGRRVLYEPAAVVVHHEGQTAGTDLASGYKRFQAVNQGKFLDKWGAALALQDAPPSRTGRPPTTADRARLAPATTAEQAALAGVTGPLRLLVVDPVMPLYDRASGSLRLWHLLHILRAEGHDIVYIARDGSGQERYGAELQARGIEVHATDPDKLRALGRPVQAPPVDLEGILARGVDVAWLSFFDIAEQYLPDVRRLSPRTRVLIDTVDVHYVRLLREAELRSDERRLAEAEAVRERERRIYAQADVLVAITEQDRQAILELLPEADVAVVPNIHVLPHAGGRPFSQRKGMLFVGNFSHPPNGDAVRWFRAEVLPQVRQRLSGAPFVIVGNNPPPDIRALDRRDLTIVTGFVPSTAPYLEVCRVSVAPLRYGAGMKGKVGEALAAGLPVVTTSIGAEGMDLQPGRHALIADDPADFAEAVVQLYSDEALWAEISREGREHVRDRLTMDHAATVVRELLAGLVRR